MTFLILIGALAFNPTLPAVAETRAAGKTAYNVTHSITDYACLLGLPYDYAYLIDQELYFLPDTGGVYGPYLMVDVEADIHAGQMAQDGILADTDCPDLVHQRGRLAQKGKPH